MKASRRRRTLKKIWPSRQQAPLDDDGKPIPGFFDDDDDDDDESGTMASHSDDDDVSTSMPTISQFGLTWMAVDNLVTEATFALSAGDGSFVDKLPPRDKYSVSVSEAWNETLASTAVPSLCSTLNISSERRRIEQNLTTLLRTFAFDRSVPAFTNERWIMLGLLFVELLLDADLLSKETIGKEVLDNANAIAVYAAPTRRAKRWIFCDNAFAEGRALVKVACR